MLNKVMERRRVAEAIIALMNKNGVSVREESTVKSADSVALMARLHKQ